MTAATNAAASIHDGDMLLRRLELRHLRYFVAVAEELSFRRAAQRLHISQPPLTTQIQQLEQLLEARLFERNKQRVMLTVAGRELLAHARRMLGAAAGLKGLVASAAHGTGRELRIGYTEFAVHVGMVLRSIQGFRLERPGVALTLRPMPSTQQVAALERAELGVGFIWALPDRVAGALDCALVQREPMVVALPRGHALCKGAGPVALAALAQERFVMIARDNGTLMFRTVVRFCQDAGFTPEIAYEAPDLASVLGLVASGAGLAVVPGVMTCFKAPGVTYRPVGGGHLPDRPALRVPPRGRVAAGPGAPGRPDELRACCHGAVRSTRGSAGHRAVTSDTATSAPSARGRLTTAGFVTVSGCPPSQPCMAFTFHLSPDLPWKLRQLRRAASLASSLPALVERRSGTPREAPSARPRPAGQRSKHLSTGCSATTPARSRRRGPKRSGR